VWDEATDSEQCEIFLHANINWECLCVSVCRLSLISRFLANAMVIEWTSSKSKEKRHRMLASRERKTSLIRRRRNTCHFRSSLVRRHQSNAQGTKNVTDDDRNRRPCNAFTSGRAHVGHQVHKPYSLPCVWLALAYISVRSVTSCSQFPPR